MHMLILWGDSPWKIKCKMGHKKRLRVAINKDKIDVYVCFSMCSKLVMVRDDFKDKDQEIYACFRSSSSYGIE